MRWDYRDALLVWLMPIVYAIHIVKEWYGHPARQRLKDRRSAAAWRPARSLHAIVVALARFVSV
jgi:hypothetical protein